MRAAAPCLPWEGRGERLDLLAQAFAEAWRFERTTQA